VFGTGFLESLRSEVLNSLNGLDGSVSSLYLDVLRLSSCSPIGLSTLFPGREFPLAFISVVVTPMSKEGVLDGNVKDGHYIPNKYIRAQQEDLIHELRKERILGMWACDSPGSGWHLTNVLQISSQYTKQVFRTHGISF